MPASALRQAGADLQVIWTMAAVDTGLSRCETGKVKLWLNPEARRAEC